MPIELDKPIVLDFSSGVVNKLHESNLPEKAALSIVNMDVLNDGTLSSRLGYQQVISGYCHSLFTNPSIDFAVFVKDGVLTQLSESLVSTPLVSVAGSVSMAVFNGKIYWSDGVSKGVITSTGLQDWGVAVPATPTLVATRDGGMNAGRYQVVLTGKNSNGEEGGASYAAEVDVSEGGGITITALSETSLIRRVYLSTANGDHLFWHSDIPADITTWVVGRSQLGKPLRTQFCTSPPVGSLIKVFQGRLLIGVDTTLYWTIGGYPGLIYPKSNFIQFSSVIKEIAPVSPGGVYVSTRDSETYFLSGNDPQEWTLQRVASIGIVPGTVVELMDEVPNAKVCWWGTDGHLYGGSSTGEIVRPLKGSFQTAGYQVGSAAMIKPSTYLDQLIYVGFR